jgi:malonate-semialdehyde dehydrogenase (acetylating)/methylmalonate-semialdehyde dehydrogenase
VRADSLKDAFEFIKNNEYGQTACIYTSSGGTAREFKYRAEANMIGVNIGIAAPMAFFPLGGKKGSFFGDIKGQGREIFQFFTDAKIIIQRWF